MNKLKTSKKMLIMTIIVYLFNLFVVLTSQSLRISLEHLLAYPIYMFKYANSIVLQQDQPIKPKDIYNMVLIGDSMTDALRDAEFQLQNFLLPFYQNRKIKVLNYGFSSTNILSVPERLLTETHYLNKTYPPLLDSSLDLVIIESFGNNPLAQYPLEVGFNKHNQVLDQIIKLIKQNNTKTKIVFLTTVAPSKKYGEGVIDLKAEVRIKWKEEREKYIENHITYAKVNKIPLIDLYSKTKDLQDSLYISQSDYIHPSYEGLVLINQTIAEFIVQQRIFPF